MTHNDIGDPFLARPVAPYAMSLVRQKGFSKIV